MSDAVWDEWKSQMKGLDPRSPLDQKARDTAVAYFELAPVSITDAARLLGLDRQTVTRRLERAHANGWLLLGESPEKVGRFTLTRSCRRRVFWTYDTWGLCPEWDGSGPPPF